MVFSSLFFIFMYLPIVLGIYYITPLKYRNVFLLLANLIFYGFGEPVYILIMVLSIFVDYTHGLLVEKYRSKEKIARYIVAQSVAINLGILMFFKYYDFFLVSLQKVLPFMDNIKPLGLALPIGISFYTFQTMSYTIDIYRQDAKAQKNIIDFGVYVTLFPQLIAGPIVKYKDLSSQLKERTHSVEQFAQGVKIFTLGLCKKVLLANNIGMLWDVYKAKELGSLSVVGAWLGIIAFAFQIFFDFSGYSDMARGLGRMLGFEFKENFNYPYISKSITEFWRRWHISLGTWFREYLYIPLGGNKKNPYRNIVIVWFATGLWHGAQVNFILWGLFFGAIMLLEKKFLLQPLQKVPAVFAHLYTLIIVCISWVLFAIEGTGLEAVKYMKNMFAIGATPLIDTDTLYYLNNYKIVLLLCTVCSIPVFHKIKISQQDKDVVTPILIIIALVLCTAYLVDATYNPFLYFRF